MSNKDCIFMSGNGRCPLLMSAIMRFFHKEFIVVYSGLQLFVRYLEVSAIRVVRLLDVLLYTFFSIVNQTIKFFVALRNNFVNLIVATSHPSVGVLINHIRTTSNPIRNQSIDVQSAGNQLTSFDSITLA